MQLFYYRGRRANFGDELNVWMWHQLSPGLIDCDERELLVGAGTLLAADVPGRFPRAERIVSVGSGAGYAAVPDVSRPPWSIDTVRGPVTARLLGLPKDAIGTDSAILLGAIPELRPLPESQRDGIVFMPHYAASDKKRWRVLCDQAGIIYLDPSWDSRALTERIRSAQLVLADAMHAAIVADTMRVPWAPVVSSAHISSTKWIDWTASMGVKYAPSFAPPVSIEARTQDRFLAAYGEAHQVDPPHLDNPELIARFGRLHPPSRSAWLRTRLTKVSVRAMSKSYEAVRKPAFAQVAPSDFLHTLRRGSNFLSEQNVFDEKLAMMSERVAALRARKKLPD